MNNLELLKIAEKQDCESFVAQDFDVRGEVFDDGAHAFQNAIVQQNQQKQNCFSKKCCKKHGTDSNLLKFRQQYFDRYDDIKYPCKFVREDW